MFLSYSINSKQTESLISCYGGKLNFDKDYSCIQEEVVGSQLTADIIEKNLLNGTKLQELWFPTNLTFDICLSHAHKDAYIHTRVVGLFGDMTIALHICFYNFGVSPFLEKIKLIIKYF